MGRNPVSIRDPRILWHSFCDSRSVWRSVTLRDTILLALNKKLFEGNRIQLPPTRSMLFYVTRSDGIQPKTVADPGAVPSDILSTQYTKTIWNSLPNEFVSAGSSFNFEIQIRQVDTFLILPTFFKTK